MTTTYCSDSDIDNRFGATNVTSWADLDNDGNATTISDRKDRARVVSKDVIDSVLRCTHYNLPAANAAGTTPVLIVELEACLAGVWLYENRGVFDFNPKTNVPYHRLTFARREARQQLEAIRMGRLKLDAV